MDQERAEMIARALSGEAWDSGGGVWLVKLYREDDCSFVIISGDTVAEYESDEAFESGDPITSIELGTTDWVIDFGNGDIAYADQHLKVGWRCQEDAEEWARSFDEPCMARRIHELED